MDKIAVFSVLLLFLFTACSTNNSELEAEAEKLEFEEAGREVPSFSADSSYFFIEQQVNFGPRHPNSEGHQKARDYLHQTLQKYAGSGSVFLQEFNQEGYEGDTLEMSNIVASFNPQSRDRILLCAHWDTRPRADKDSVDSDQPIIGADDGGSGVGLLLELARIFQDQPPPIGVDIVLFDGEDYGREGDLDNYFLGSRYWSENQPVEDYRPRFGILVDMVGGKNARFYQERNSLSFAPKLIEEVWNIAREKKYDTLFVDETGSAINDDHIIISRTLNLPVINIINHQPSDLGSSQFAPYWHTHGDNMEIIDRNTLQAVGDVMLELIYNRL